MKTVCQADKCTGCKACVDICPTQAIAVRDNLTAYNAVIDSERCIDCDACTRVCGQNNPMPLRTPIAWYQGWAADEQVRAAGSSGGIAGALSRGFIKTGGVVCSCAFADGEFRFRIARTEQEVAAFAGSKYIKSDPAGIYPSVKQLLKQGTDVLFIGLPCQCAAVQRFVGAALQERLYTVDLICHGSPSPVMLDAFLARYGVKRHDLRDPSFRDKGQFRFADEGNTYAPKGTRDRYTLSFLNMLTYTENCYSCPYACTQRVSDLSLGDSWGSELPQQQVERGISLIVCQTDKGHKLLDSADVYLTDVNPDKAIANNHQLNHPSPRPAGRQAFFEQLNKGKSFHRLVFQNFPKQCLRQKVKGALRRVLGE